MLLPIMLGQKRKMFSFFGESVVGAGWLGSAEPLRWPFMGF